jgi:hypothetical protein
VGGKEEQESDNYASRPLKSMQDDVKPLLLPVPDKFVHEKKDCKQQ